MNKLIFNNRESIDTFNFEHKSEVSLPSSFPAILIYNYRDSWTYSGNMIGSYEWVELKDFIVPIVVSEYTYEDSDPN